MERVCKSWHYGLSALKVQFTISLLQSHREIFFVTRAISRFVVLDRKVLNSLNALEINVFLLISLTMLNIIQNCFADLQNSS